MFGDRAQVGVESRSRTEKALAAHWLRRAGPFEKSERSVGEIESRFEFWRETALDGRAKLEELKIQLREADEVIEELDLDDG
jgi:hypothetical protein